MKMHSNKYSKILYHFLLGIISVVVTTLPCAASIPTTLSPITASVNKTPILHFNTVENTDEKIEIKSHNMPNNKQSESSLPNINNGSNKDFTTSSINNSNSNNAEEQLTALSADENNTPSINSMIKNNAILSDSGDSTSLPFLSSTESMRLFSNNNKSDKNSLQNGITQTAFTSIPESAYNKEQQTQLPAPQYHAGVHYEANRHKRSHYHKMNLLNSNLEDLMNIRRQRRALRYKRNTNYEDFLASLLAAEEAKYNDNYNTYPSSTTNEVNLADDPQTLYYLLNHLNDDDNNFVDSDKSNKYYYNVLPLLEIDNEDDSTSNEDSVSQELPVVIQPYAQQVIPVLPYPLSNRYQRIRRSYYRKYANPLSLYTGLRRKRNRNNNYNYENNKGEWGRIVGRKDERTTYEDDAGEANKIYSLATLLATGITPEEYSQRYKRSVKPVMNIM